jgi:hypothetical protein
MPCILMRRRSTWFSNSAISRQSASSLTFTVLERLALVPLWLAGLFYLFATQDGKRYRPIGWMFIIPFLLFVIGRGRGYYMAPGYPMLLAAGAVWGERWVASLSPRRALVIRRTTWMALAIGALVDAAIVLPIAPPGSLWWRFADKANGGDFNEEIGWSELVQTIASIRDSLPVEERARLGIPGRRFRPGWRNQSLRPCAEVAEGNLRDELSLASRGMAIRLQRR